MTCEACQQRQATVHYSEMINGQTTELHLCESCAKEKGIGENFPFHVPFSIGGLLSGLMEQAFSTPTQIESKTTGDMCKCGMTLEEFKRTGFLGCSECYKTFKRSLGALLRKIHGVTEHVGTAPAKLLKFSTGMTKAERLKRLRRDLAKAVEEERYEEAAALRDQIHTLSGKSELSGKGEGSEESGESDQGRGREGMKG